MKASIKLLAVVLLSAVALPSCHRDSLTEDLDLFFTTVPEFSGVVLIADQGKVVYHKAFGFRKFDTKSSMDTTSIFELASVSKQFTAMTIMMLKEEGKLSYDDSVARFIPGLPYPGITVRHLLNHTSGLPDYQQVMDSLWDKSKVAGNADNIEYLIRYPPRRRFAPGTAYEYSNTGYMLLASIAEKASGQDFISFCNERIFTPLQMKATNIRSLEEKRNLPNMAWGHIYTAKKNRYMRADSFPKFNYTIWLGNRRGPGRISSTTSDLLRWDRALYSEELVKKATLHEAFTPATLQDGSTSYYGFGWTLEQDPLLGQVVRHSGSNPGYKTHIIRCIDKDKTAILLCNNEYRDYDKVLSKVEKACIRLAK